MVSANDRINAAELPEHMRQIREPAEGKTLSAALESLERRLILDAYERCGTTTGVAKALGISQPTAARKIARYRRS